MNRELKIARLQTVLERVQKRAKDGPRKASRAQQTLIAEESPTQPTGVALQPHDAVAPLPPMIVAPAGDATETDETRPFAKMTAAQLSAPSHAAIPQGPKAPLGVVPEAGTESTRRTTDRPAAPHLEPEQPEAEAPISSRRPAQHEIEPVEMSLEADVLTEKHDTEPPASGPQPLAQPADLQALAGIEVDFEGGPLDRAAIEAPSLPSTAQLGQMVELEELSDDAQALIELAPPPVLEAAPSTISEMEATLPAPQSPGAYTPELAPTDRGTSPAQPAGMGDVFGPEPGTSDWETPAEAREASGVIDAGKPARARDLTQVAEAGEAPTATAAPGAEVSPRPEPTLESVKAPETTALPLAAAAVGATGGVLRLIPEPAPGGKSEPIELQVVAEVTAPKQVAAANVAVFMGAVREFKPASFVELLEASLDLGDS